MYDTNRSTVSINRKRLKEFPCLIPLAKLKEEVIKPFMIYFKIDDYFNKGGWKFHCIQILYNHR